MRVVGKIFSVGKSRSRWLVGIDYKTEDKRGITSWIKKGKIWKRK